MAELKQFRLPDVGEGLTEADIIKWHVQPGDRVTINQIIVEIETAKAVVELPSPYEGVVAGLLVPEGTTADVGTPIISVEVGPDAGSAPALGQPLAPRGSTSADLVPPPPAEGGVEPGIHGTLAPKEEERPSVLVGSGVKPGATTRRPRKAPAAASSQAPPAAPAVTGAAPASAPSSGAVRAGASLAAVPAAAGPAGPAASGDGAAVLAKPPVRKLAKDLGVDLARLSGTGPGGSITRDDVQSAARGLAAAEAAPSEGAASPAQFAPVTAVAREERIPIRGVRKHMAAAMVGSAFSAPHVTEFLQIDITETMAATARLRTLPEFGEVRVSPLLLVARALMIAVARHPMINSSWDEEAQEIVVRHYVNLGVAAATDRGLVVPNIRDAHALSLPGLARALAELTETARAGRATPADLRGGTITITNVGVFGVDTGTPILSPGEAAILAFGRVKDAPWVHQGQLAVRKVTTLALSFDHRIVDGDLGSAVLRDIGAMLEDPLRMLAWS
ncbi:MAG TPA: dihydrolipoamide acetyltransferase family protein [Streptosporangiaceae bacterium]|nr:dihydrolipoamide acetyltransferase family protein [Streptosporangiaceae bacterium]